MHSTLNLVENLEFISYLRNVFLKILVASFIFNNNNNNTYNEIGPPRLQLLPESEFKVLHLIQNALVFY